MKEISELHPDRFESDVAPEPAPAAKPKSDEVVDRWLTETFHGPHHIRAMADPQDFITRAAEDLKRRLKEESPP